MHKLARQVRFSINPFLPADVSGFNPFTSEPTGEGLAIFLELAVEIAGEVDKATGFVVNVSEIDKKVRQYTVPIFAQRLRDEFRAGRNIGWQGIVELLEAAKQVLSDKFGTGRVSEIGLKLNPLRKMTLSCEGKDMVYLSEKFDFSATHKLWNKDFPEAKNVEMFGKCANPTGHGHNYIVEVTVEMAQRGKDFDITAFERAVDAELITTLDHKNLNQDVAEFKKTNPTVENIAVFAWHKLIGRFSSGKLNRITVWETEKTSCTYCG